ISKAFCTSILLPVLTMVAEYDDMVNVNFSEDLTDAFPKGKFKVLQQSYHPIEKVSIPTLSKHLIDFFTYL
nr:hypothetical protein [Cyclobacteriaceae bacterium]